ncbi:MAG: hypothetical protein AAF986_01725, partial [Pseudomonadota bacterium]
MKWSTEQDAALSAASKWLNGKRESQVFRLFGYAGTGKTTLAQHLAVAPPCACARACVDVAPPRRRGREL